MAEYNLKKGYDIRINGTPESSWGEAVFSETVALYPHDFPGVVPKLTVKEGDTVKTGTPLFYSKANPDIKFTSTASGTVEAITRGARRLVTAVIVKQDKNQSYEEFEKISAEALLSSPRGKVLGELLKAGLLGLFRQRPFEVVPDPTKAPRDIFISCYRTAPLSPDINLILEGKEEEWQAGINALTRLTDGKVYVSYEGGGAKVTDAITGAKNCELNTFTGPHPAGNVGIQAHHIKPVNSKDTIWTLKPGGVIAIGSLFLSGHLKGDRTIAVAGESATNRKHFKVIAGSRVDSVLQGNVNATGPLRFIAGNVLTGKNVGVDGYLGFNNNLLTVIPEVDGPEFLGWALPGLEKESFSRTFFSYLFGKKAFSHNTSMGGGKRALVLTGYYEQVFPMDIYPMHLIKSILCEDIEEMEALGLLEVAEEDFALCEYICPSKTEIQQIIRNGLNLYRKEN